MGKCPCAGITGMNSHGAWAAKGARRMSQEQDKAGKLMQGFPPAPEHQVDLSNWRSTPFNAWAFHHVRELLPTAAIPNAPGRVRPLERAYPDFRGLRIDAGRGPNLDLSQFMAAAEVDGIVILYKGRLVHESYANGMTADSPHILMSVSKSLLGLLAGILIEKGQLDADREATFYIPELQDTAFAGASVRQLLDMRSGVTFNEDYSEVDGLYQRYRKAVGWNPSEAGDPPLDLRSFFSEMTASDGPHGGPFRYISPCTDLLAWVIERATERRYADLMSELLLAPMGAEHAAYITVDRFGAPRAAGGICCTTRDLARVGQLLVESGDGIVPGTWIEDITYAGDSAAWDASDFAPFYPGLAMHYRAQCYVIREPAPVIMGIGIHGQSLMVDREAELVLAKHASAADPLAIESERLTLALFRALQEYLGAL